MAEEKMSLIEQLMNPPRTQEGRLDEDKVIDLMREAASALLKRPATPNTPPIGLNDDFRPVLATTPAQ